MDDAKHQGDFNFTATATVQQPCQDSIVSRHGSNLKLMLAFTPNTVQLVRLLLPLWVALGVPGSVINLAVWSSRKLRTSSSVYLCALAVLDGAFLLLQQLPWHLHAFYDLQLVDNAAMCAAFPVFSLWLQYLSPLLILAFTVERFVAIFHPFASRRLSTPARSVGVAGCLAAACLPLALVQISFFRYDGRLRRCLDDERVFDEASVRHRLYHAWTKTTEVLFFAVIPMAILVFNILVLTRVRQLSTASVQPRHRQSDVMMAPAADRQRAATLTLLCVSFYQIGATAPVSALLFAGYHVARDTDLGALTCNMTDLQVAAEMSSGRLPGVSGYFRHAMASSLTSALAVSHNAVKLWIYLATGAAFRRQLARMLASGWRPRQRSQASNEPDQRLLPLTPLRAAVTVATPPQTPPPLLRRSTQQRRLARAATVS